MLDHFLKSRLKKIFERSCVSVEQVHKKQESRWRQIRHFLRDTSIGRDKKIAMHDTFSSFQKNTAPMEYSDIEPYINRILAGESNVLFPGNPVCFGLTSGTTGKHGKRIPYNKESIAVFYRARQFVISSFVANGQLSETLRNIKSLNIASSPNVEAHGKYRLGYISGILDQQKPWYVRNGLYPKGNSSNLEHWQSKVNALFNEVKNVPLNVISGVPAVVAETLKEFCKIAKVSHSCDIWPNLKINVYGGSDIANMHRNINSVHGKNLSHFGIYMSSEAPIGNSFEPWNGTSKYTLNCEVLFTFSDKSNQFLNVRDLVVGETYQLYVTSMNGFLQYPLRDQIRVLSVDPIFLFEPIGRLGGALNLATEKITEGGLSDAIVNLAKKLNLEINHFMVMPRPNKERLAYQFILFSDHTDPTAAAHLDVYLQSHNQDYQKSRQSNILEMPEVYFRPSNIVRDYVKLRSSKGQVKVQIVFQTEIEFETYCHERLEWDPQL